MIIENYSLNKALLDISSATHGWFKLFIFLRKRLEV